MNKNAVQNRAVSVLSKQASVTIRTWRKDTKCSILIGIGFSLVIYFYHPRNSPIRAPLISFCLPLRSNLLSINH